ncbi:MAG: hypothetical protein QM330_09610 [Acidobacteriota bacterium]|nr:hypothetical protein [Acidobacteriota bacterium]
MATIKGNPVILRSAGLEGGEEGFGLVEALIAVFILALGMMFVGPMIADAVQNTSLSRSKDTASLAAANQMEALNRLYRANPGDANLSIGNHGPVQVEIVNPSDNSKLNRYNVSWTVAEVLDPRPGKTLSAVQVTTTATPIGAGTAANLTVRQNKVVSITTIFSLRVP